MRISLMGGSGFPLVAESTITALIKEISATSLILQVGKREVSLSIRGLTEKERAELAPLQMVRIEQTAGKLILTKLPADKDAEAQVSFSKLEVILQDLAVPVNPLTLKVARALVEEGFPLRQELLWQLLPYAEEGKLEEALLLLKGEFPLTEELVELASSLIRRREGEPLVQEEISTLDSRWQRAYTKPKWENREKVVDIQDRELFRGIVRALVQEKMLERIFNRDSLQQEYVFSLPFLLGDILHTSLVRLTRKRNSHQRAEESSNRFRIALEIPTLSLGVVFVEILLENKVVDLNFWFEQDGTNVSEETFSQLLTELESAGWELGSLQVKQVKGDAAHAQSSCFKV